MPIVTSFEQFSITPSITANIRLLVMQLKLPIHFYCFDGSASPFYVTLYRQACSSLIAQTHTEYGGLEIKTPNVALGIAIVLTPRQYKRWHMSMSYFSDLVRFEQ